MQLLPTDKVMDFPWLPRIKPLTDAFKRQAHLRLFILFRQQAKISEERRKHVTYLGCTLPHS